MKGAKIRLGRRTVLRGCAAGGAAVAIPLPRLGAMLDGNGIAYADGTALPNRFVLWFFGNGMTPGRWDPVAEGVGDAWQLSEQLAPLGPVKSHLTVISGLNYGWEQNHGGAHYQCMAQSLTGSNTRGGPGEENDSIDQNTAASIDQVIHGASGFGALPLLHIALIKTKHSDGGVTNSISWKDPGVPSAPEYSPSAVFTKLTGTAPGGTTPAGAGAAKKILSSRKSALDLVMEDARQIRLSKWFNAEDGKRIDQHLQGFRDLELQIMRAPLGAANPTASPVMCPGGAGGKLILPADNQDLMEVPPEIENAMADLMTMALACDRTRVIAFEFSIPLGDYFYRHLGITEGAHALCHTEGGREYHEGDTNKTIDQPRVHKNVVYTMGQLASFLGKLAGQSEGQGTLLDNSCVYVTSDIGWGWTHERAVALIAGKAGGTLRGNVHVKGGGVASVLGVVRQALGVGGSVPGTWSRILA